VMEYASYSSRYYGRPPPPPGHTQSPVPALPSTLRWAKHKDAALHYMQAARRKVPAPEGIPAVPSAGPLDPVTAAVRAAYQAGRRDADAEDYGTAESVKPRMSDYIVRSEGDEADTEPPSHSLFLRDKTTRSKSSKFQRYKASPVRVKQFRNFERQASRSPSLSPPPAMGQPPIYREFDTRFRNTGMYASMPPQTSANFRRMGSGRNECGKSKPVASWR
jgi:hypothetical protein